MKKQCNHWWHQLTNPSGKLKGLNKPYVCVNCGELRSVDNVWGEIGIWNEKKDIWEKLK